MSNGTIKVSFTVDLCTQASLDDGIVALSYPIKSADVPDWIHYLRSSADENTEDGEIEPEEMSYTSLILLLGKFETLEGDDNSWFVCYGVPKLLPARGYVSLPMLGEEEVVHAQLNIVVENEEPRQDKALRERAQRAQDFARACFVYSAGRGRMDWDMVTAALLEAASLMDGVPYDADTAGDGEVQE